MIQSICYFLAIQIVQAVPSGTARHPVFRELGRRTEEETV